MRLYEQKLEQVDRLTEMLIKGTKKLATIKKEKHLSVEKRLERNHPKQLLSSAEERFERSQKNIHRSMVQILTKKQTDFDRTLSTLQALSPLKIMDRGYSLVYKGDKLLVKSIQQVRLDDEVRIKMTDGDLLCKVQEIKGSEQ